MGQWCRSPKIAISVLGLLLGALSQVACTRHEINTWPRWCEHITEVDLEAKYGRLGTTFGVAFNAEGIRADFVESYNEIHVGAVAARYLDGAAPTDPVVTELIKLKMVGVWRDGTVLHWANGLLMPVDPFGVDDYDGYVQAVRTDLEDYRAGRGVNDGKRCLWGTVEGVFDQLVLHGPENLTETLPLRHTLGRGQR